MSSLWEYCWDVIVIFLIIDLLLHTSTSHLNGNFYDPTNALQSVHHTGTRGSHPPPELKVFICRQIELLMGQMGGTRWRERVYLPETTYLFLNKKVLLFE